MKFDITGSTGSGSTHCPVNFENLLWYDQTPLQFRLNLKPEIRPADSFESDKRDWLELTWFYLLFYKGAELFQFHSYYSCRVSEFETPPTKEQLTELVVNSHKSLQKIFDENRGEYHIFEPIVDISDDTIERTVDQLYEFLLPIQG